MRNTYFDIIDQTYYFPQEGFKLKDDRLLFHGIDLIPLLQEHGSPLRITYLPKIGQQIRKARKWFEDAMAESGYTAKYHYCYCTKSSHFSFVMDEVLKNGSHLETSSAYDIDLIKRLHKSGKISKKIRIICNGFKPKSYTDRIKELVHAGFDNIIPILDNMEEINAYQDLAGENINFGMRIAAEEEPNYQFYTSRLGIRYADLIPFYLEKIKPDPRFKLQMLHFFIDSGIKDTAYYWSELGKCLNIYVELKKVSPGLRALNIGGGLPIRNSLGSRFQYGYVIQEIVNKIKLVCDEAGVEYPDIYTEFGSFTVGESGAMLFEIIGQKKQNESELWYMIDGSLMTTLPDVWGMHHRFILLPINHWNQEYQRANIGGLSCDVGDYYNSEVDINQVYMPKIYPGQKLYIGFFHTGAYQDSLSGYGGIKHCLIPGPKHLIMDRQEEDGPLTYKVFRESQTPDEMLEILGYDNGVQTGKK